MTDLTLLELQVITDWKRWKKDKQKEAMTMTDTTEQELQALKELQAWCQKYRARIGACEQLLSISFENGAALYNIEKIAFRDLGQTATHFYQQVRTIKL